MGLTADQIRSVADCTPIPLDVPEWGGSVWIKPLNAAEWIQYIDGCSDAAGQWVNAGCQSKLAALALCDETGIPLFGFDDWPALEKRSAAAIQRIYDAATKLSRMTPKDREDAKKN